MSEAIGIITNKNSRTFEYGLTVDHIIWIIVVHFKIFIRRPLSFILFNVYYGGARYKKKMGKEAENQKLI